MKKRMRRRKRIKRKRYLNQLAEAASRQPGGSGEELFGVKRGAFGSGDDEDDVEYGEDDDYGGEREDEEDDEDDDDEGLSSGVDETDYPGKSGVIFEDSDAKKGQHQLARTYNGFKSKKGLKKPQTDKKQNSPGGTGTQEASPNGHAGFELNLADLDKA